MRQTSGRSVDRAQEAPAVVLDIVSQVFFGERRRENGHRWIEVFASPSAEDEHLFTRPNRSLAQPGSRGRRIADLAPSPRLQVKDAAVATILEGSSVGPGKHEHLT